MNGKGWGQVLLEEFEASGLAEQLTVETQDGNFSSFRIVGEEVLVPRRYTQFFKSGISEVTAFPGGDFFGAEPISLRPHQVEAVDQIEKRIRLSGGEILEAGCGQGKTVMGLEIARRLGVPTLVLVHKEFLMNQWMERIQKFLPGVAVGKWQQNVSDSGEDCDVVVGMVQSISGSRNYPKEIYDSFGLVITDEVHRAAAPTWQEAITRFPAQYRLGLTADHQRRDGLHPIFIAHIGEVGYKIHGQALIPQVKRVNLPTKLNRSSYLWRGEVNYSKLTTLLSSVEDRTAVIISHIKRAAEAGRKILVLTGRRNHAFRIEELARQSLSGDFRVAVYLGGMKDKALKISQEADVIVGTFHMAQEALDIEAMDTLMLATPQTSITQATGRILRPLPGKKAPLVIDFVDNQVDVCWGMYLARKRLYAELGYQ
jgi:superfamily II DNA or RNA helicase